METRRRAGSREEANTERENPHARGAGVGPEQIVTRRSMTFDQYLAAYALGKVLSSDLPDVGEQALKEGYDSVGLAVLAGSTSRSESPRELEEMFMRGIRHVNKVIPSRAEAARVLRDYYAALVATGAMPPRVGAGEIVRLEHELRDVFPPREYAGDGLGVARIYGL